MINVKVYHIAGLYKKKRLLVTPNIKKLYRSSTTILFLMSWYVRKIKYIVPNKKKLFIVIT